MKYSDKLLKVLRKIGVPRETKACICCANCYNVVTGLGIVLNLLMGKERMHAKQIEDLMKVDDRSLCSYKIIVDYFVGRDDERSMYGGTLYRTIDESLNSGFVSYIGTVRHPDRTRFSSNPTFLLTLGRRLGIPVVFVPKEVKTTMSANQVELQTELL